MDAELQRQLSALQHLVEKTQKQLEVRRELAMLQARLESSNLELRVIQDDNAAFNEKKAKIKAMKELKSGSGKKEDEDKEDA